MVEFIADCARALAFSEEKVGEVELTAEEAVVNVCAYAYPADTGELEICCAEGDGGRLIVEIVDSGDPYNPLEAEAPDLDAELSDRKIGGLGIFFMRQFTEAIQYRRADGKNRLSLVFQKA
jgi:anti-sigma regulatory factor (Ser/Thr protein kinase)